MQKYACIYRLKPSDIGHKESRKVLEEFAFKRKYKLYISPYALAEICNAICRKIKDSKYRLIDPLQDYIEKFENYEEKCRLLISIIITFLRERLGVELIDSEELYKLKTVESNRLRIPRIFAEVITLPPRLPIRTKDLLHLVYTYLLARIYNIKYFLTRDIKDFKRVKDTVKQLLQIDIVLVE